MTTPWAALLLLPLLAPDGVREVTNLAYVDGPDADAEKHKLDLYLPRGATKFPVLMWIHGGAWSFGDRAWFGAVGRRFAEEGIGAAIISYRLSPKVKHPAHVEDCARAFAWLHDHVADYGGDPGRLFVSGQSAGGHLAALLACDPQYLRALKVPDDALKGVIPMSGVYTIPALPPQSKGLLGMFPTSFGSDPKVCRDASPSSHLAELSVPMLVITETEDSAPLRFDARCLGEAARRNGVKDIRFIDAEKKNHFSIVSSLAAKAPDPSRSAMVEFIRGRCRDLDR
jgi:acetyl esterase/lipase